MVASFLWANRENLAASLASAADGVGEFVRVLQDGDEASLAGLLGRMAPHAAVNVRHEAALSFAPASEADYRNICDQLAASRLLISSITVRPAAVDVLGRLPENSRTGRPI